MSQKLDSDVLALPTPGERVLPVLPALSQPELASSLAQLPAPAPLNVRVSDTFGSTLRTVSDKICIFPETQSILTECNKWKVILQEMKI